MSDDDVGSKVESGDLFGVPGARELTAEETGPVIGASADFSDTGGFAPDAGFRLRTHPIGAGAACPLQ